MSPIMKYVAYYNELRIHRAEGGAAIVGEAGYVDGRNVAVEYRFAESRHERVPALAADLVGRPAIARVELVKCRRKLLQRRVNQLTDRSQWIERRALRESPEAVTFSCRT